MLGVGLREQIFKNRNLRQSGNPSQRLGLLIFHDAAQQVDLAILQPNLVLNLALPDHGLADAANAHV